MDLKHSLLDVFMTRVEAMEAAAALAKGARRVKHLHDDNKKPGPKSTGKAISAAEYMRQWRKGRTAARRRYGRTEKNREYQREYMRQYRAGQRDAA